MVISPQQKPYPWSDDLLLILSVYPLHIDHWIMNFMILKILKDTVLNDT